jgi:hypothetical protein
MLWRQPAYRLEMTLISRNAGTSGLCQESFIELIPSFRGEPEKKRRYTQWGTRIPSVGRSLNSRRVTFTSCLPKGSPLFRDCVRRLQEQDEGLPPSPILVSAVVIFFDHRIRNSKHNQLSQTYVPEETLPWK